MNKLTKKQTETFSALKYTFIDAVSASYDWSTGYGDSWDIIRPDTYEMDTREIKTRAEYYNINTDCCNLAALAEKVQEEIYIDPQYEPMINYYTDLGDVNAENMAEKFDGSCFTVIRFYDGEVGLALTGGGMDMRWSMAEAFINAGYFPPAYVCELPAMAGKTNALTIAACNETLKTLSDRYLWAIKRNKEISNNP